MIPFYVLTAGYWIFYIPNTEPGLITMLLKIAPTVALYYGVLRKSRKVHENSFRKGYYNNIAYGLLASVVGDAAMVWDSLFLGGIIAFAVAHYFYITALNTKGKGVFGNDFLKSVGLGCVIYGLAAIIWYTLLKPGLQDDLILYYGVPIYITWLATTVWRSGSVGDTRMLTGSLLFMISDACIGIDRFSFTIPYAQVIIMATYQAGQFLIAMSTFLVVNEAAVKLK